MSTPGHVLIVFVVSVEMKIDLLKNTIQLFIYHILYVTHPWKGYVFIYVN